MSYVFEIDRSISTRIPDSNSADSYRSSRGRRTDSGGLNHVADGESLDGLVLGSASRAVGASDGLDVTTALLVTSARMRNFVLVHFENCMCAYPSRSIHC